MIAQRKRVVDLDGNLEVFERNRGAGAGDCSKKAFRRLVVAAFDLSGSSGGSY